MTARQMLAAAVTGAVALLAVAGSATNLAVFARSGHAHTVTFPGVGELPLGMWAFIAALDGLALVMALQVHDATRDRIDRLALAVLVACTAASAALQYLAAGDTWEDQTVATAPVVLAGVATAMFFRSLHSARPVAPSSTGAGSGAATGTGAPLVATAPAPTFDQTAASVATPARGQGTEPPAKDDRHGLTAAAADTGGGPGDHANDVVVPPAIQDEAHEAIAQHLDGRIASRRSVSAAAAELGIPMGSTRAGRLAKAIQLEDIEQGRHVAS